MLGKSRSHLLDTALSETVSMLEKSHEMFGVAWKALTEGREVDTISQADQDINSGERIVRRLVIEHLTLNPEQDLPWSLTLVSIIHDVERLGDYAKSMVELVSASHTTLSTEGLGQVCRDAHAGIEPLFQLAIDGIRYEDESKARDLMERHLGIRSQTDAILTDVLKNDQSSREDVLASLLSRYLRRTSGHLSNVASSITNPFDLIARND